MAAEETIVDPDFYARRAAVPAAHVCDRRALDRAHRQRGARRRGAARGGAAAHGAPSGRVRVALLGGRELALDGEPDALLGEGERPAARGDLRARPA